MIFFSDIEKLIPHRNFFNRYCFRSKRLIKICFKIYISRAELHDKRPKLYGNEFSVKMKDLLKIIVCVVTQQLLC